MTSTSVHVLTFDEDRTWDDLLAQRPAAATYWHQGVMSPPESSGIPVPNLRAWTVLACWESPEQWSEALHGPGPWQRAAEAWSALLAPGPTRYLPAPTRWADGYVTPPFGEPQGRLPEGEVAIVTTVGLAPEDLGNALRFVADVDRVVGTLARTPGNHGFRLGSGERFPSPIDAFTFSLWSDLAAVRAWAYEEGVHASAIDAHMDRPHVLRGSFTTFSVLQTRGTWSDRHVFHAPAAAPVA